ncbi:MAG: class II D-tagatose-bisphosphate aldolase, non-catalytic subunit [Geothrix sp.]|uniref:class II D-tagatose-bisphosphate aldolase, non-catalytic subunit n=1 Tax=Geothrix sp. TaxID=1962974 RepID=UPI0017FB376A|nr:class II D-tagatose-bisphosphate aldolase, non-catalytic subunit [Geothrix sp.]NWJ41892.1 class II D-tagatose-bisphosphate aldolase, non-catalytic subunit [Geothrix sp.]WIL20135.1 MAG: class II D-tagatose-bisphosphate aldolase, non-catalytic subunit [Geothrix sp.]
MSELLRLREDCRAAAGRGIYSVCSAHPVVLRAALDQAREDASPVLIEATCNQVNQAGGYTGMTPADFKAFVETLAREAGLPGDRLILGGDHLGPNPWRNQPAAAAMAQAEALVDAYVSAGFHKIHLDASMRCADDPAVLPDAVIAERAGRLCLRAEQAHGRRGGGPPPVYVIGTEVPMPGGAVEEEAGLRPTAPSDVARTLDLSQATFARLGLESAWERVVALVVQPGVEFGEASVHDYDRGAAAPLTGAIARRLPWMYEAHSTDYQSPAALRQLVEDRFAILKVGPWLTFAFREAVFSLEQLARELQGRNPRYSCPPLAATLEAAMLREPGHWQDHHHGTAGEQAFARRFSLSDRSRYYWGDPAVREALEALFRTLEGPLPLELISQYRPREYDAVRAGIIRPSGRALAIHSVRRVLGHYAAACGLSMSVAQGGS